MIEYASYSVTANLLPVMTTVTAKLTPTLPAHTQCVLSPIVFKIQDTIKMYFKYK